MTVDFCQGAGRNENDTYQRRLDNSKTPAFRRRAEQTSAREHSANSSVTGFTLSRAMKIFYGAVTNLSSRLVVMVRHLHEFEFMEYEEITVIILRVAIDSAGSLRKLL